MYFNQILLIVMLGACGSQLAIADTEIPGEFVFFFGDEDEFFEAGSIDSSDEDNNVLNNGHVAEQPPTVPQPYIERRRQRESDESEGGFSDEEDTVHRPAGKQRHLNVETALMVAARNNNVAEIDRLALIPGFDVNAQNEYGATALHAAAGADAVAAAIRLLELGAARDIQNQLGEKPYQKARERGFDLLSDALSE
jgi:hypothetical protein